MNTYKTGLFAEWLVRCFLRIHGFGILSARYVTGKHTQRAEIDIIARRGNLIIFVEVKARKDLRQATEAVTRNQAQRLRRSAETYLLNKHWKGDARFDLIAVCGWHIHWIKNAF